MKINRSQYEAAYNMGLKVYDDEIGIADARRNLEKLGVNRHSAADLFYGVTHFLKGQKYTRSLSLTVVDDYLNWLRRDRGHQAAANALTAVNKHIVYYEALRKTHCPGLRKLVAKHSSIVTTPASIPTAPLPVPPRAPEFKHSAILLRWMDSETEAFTDVLPFRFFADTTPKIGETHAVLGPFKARFEAMCNVTVRGLMADLDYEPYVPYNKKQGMQIGVARLQFSDTDRTAIERVQWKPEGDSVFNDCTFALPEFLIPAAPPYVPPLDKSLRRIQLIRERPGQAKFRRHLKGAYRNRCCMTGCTVAEVLEGAHIDSYVAPQSDSIRNGLLLRRDVHALFDKNLIAVDPESLLIYVADGARGASGYAALHETPLVVPSDPSHRPDAGALTRRWSAFRNGPS